MFVLDSTRGIESRSVTASSTNVTYSFPAFRNAPFTGLLLVDLQQPIPTTASDSLPVQFGSVQVLASDGSNATVATFGGPGAASLVLVYYNSRTGRLQLIGNYEAASAVATSLDEPEREF